MAVLAVFAKVMHFLRRAHTVFSAELKTLLIQVQIIWKLI